MLHNKSKMEITRQNYEAYLLDYIEGNLPENMVLAVLAFLRNNPEIEEESKSIPEFSIPVDHLTYNKKNTLKKNINYDIPGISKFEQLSIANLENDLSETEAKQLEILLQKHVTLRNQHDLLQKTRLHPDMNIFFPSKKDIHRSYKKRIIIPTSLIYMAASIILLVGFGILYYQTNETNYSKGITYTAFNYSTQKMSELRPEILPDKSDRIFIKVVDTETDTLQNRIKSKDQYISSLGVSDFQVTNQSNIESLIAKNPVQYSQNIALNEDYTPIQKYIKDKFNEKVLKQDKNEKFTVISFINAFGRFTNKVFHKKLEVEKTTNEAGELLYAIKTDNFDFYTKRNLINKDNSSDNDKNKKPENQRRKE